MVKFFRAIGWHVQSSLDAPPMDEKTFQKFVVKNLAAGNPIIVDNIEMWFAHDLLPEAEHNQPWLIVTPK